MKDPRFREDDKLGDILRKQSPPQQINIRTVIIFLQVSPIQPDLPWP